MVKVTFTLDDDTVSRLRRTAARLARPQSRVVRDAIREYGERVGRLSDEERRQLLHAFDTLVPAIPARPVASVRAELAAIRADRRHGGRRHPASRP
jgi:hypothetical protein